MVLEVSPPFFAPPLGVFLARTHRTSFICKLALRETGPVGVPTITKPLYLKFGKIAAAAAGVGIVITKVVVLRPTGQLPLRNGFICPICYQNYTRNWWYYSHKEQFIKYLSV